MKAYPTRNNGEPCEPKDATHVKIHIPGATGKLTLPVMLRGTREGTGNWTWNGDTEKPTLKPSVLVTRGHFVQGFNAAEDFCWCSYALEHPGEEVSFKCVRCHTWITDGKAQFLSDCSHELAGQMLDLLDL